MIDKVEYYCKNGKNGLTSYKVVHRQSLLALFDLLGFSTFIENNPKCIVDKKMISIICHLKDIEDNIDISKITNGAPFKNRNKECVNQLEFRYALVSDTFIIYPNIDFNINKNLYEYQVTLKTLSAISAALFSSFLQEFNTLIRGSIVFNEYQIVKEIDALYGKAIIEAHTNESIQKWGGILPSANISTNKNNSNIMKSSYTDYCELYSKILKDTYNAEKYIKSIENKTQHKYVLNWIKTYDKLYENAEPNWKLLKEEAKKIKNKNVKDSALKKIRNTKEFYDSYKKNHTN